MTVLVQGKNSYYLAAPAGLGPESVSTDADGSSWANKHIVQNPALKWIVGNYVQADAANSNGHYWQLDDLRMKQPTISHAPLNMGHRQHYIVGTYVGSEMMYPQPQPQLLGADSAQEITDDAAQTTPYIETVAAMWKFYFPEEAAMVDKAFAEGALWSSMECIADSLTCMTDGGCGQTYAYQGPTSPSYCAEMNAGGVKQFNNPHFLAGGLIFPPNRPGWKDADVRAVSSLIKENEDKAEAIYDQISQHSPHLESAQWDSMMVDLLLRANAPKRTPQELARLSVSRIIS